MSGSGDNNALGELAYRIGYVLGEIDTVIRGKAGAATDRVDAIRHGEADEEPVPEALELEPLLIRATETWLLTRLLRPRPVRWPLVILAGLGATAFSDFVKRLETPDAPPEEAEKIAFRYGTGVATASAYAAILYPRLPGAPLTRGLLFGLIEVLAAPHGGAIALGRKLAPSLKFPLQGLALPIDEDAGPLAHMAFGVGLGILYRDGTASDDDEPAEDDDDQ